MSTPNNHPYKVLLTLLVAALLASCTPSAETSFPSQRFPSIALEDCQLSTPGYPVHIAAKCGSLRVYEDRANQSGRQFDLNIAVVPAISRNPEPDPLFLLAGGPGQAATEAYLPILGAFERIRLKRDLVLVDQRGTGKSNPLVCPKDGEDADFLQEGDLDDDTRDTLIRECLDELQGDPRFYTTTLAMEDLDQVREALGYNQINLLGVSYGTRAALVYLRQFPERVRTMILDGVAPLGWPIFSTLAQDAQRSLDLVFARCTSDPACHSAYPELEREFTELLQELDRQPIEIDLAHPSTGEPVQILFTQEKLAAVTRLLSYSSQNITLLPMFIHTAAISGDLNPLAAQYLIFVESQAGAIADGMFYSVLCSEDVPYIAVENQETEYAYLPDQTENLREICSIWPHKPVEASFHSPVTSQTPILLLSGEADPVTPPRNAEQLANDLPNSLHLVASGLGHNVLYRGCIPRIINRFIEAGSFQDLDTNCISDIQAEPFFLNLSGPNP